VKVAKFPGVAAERIARSILTAGPATAPELARRLELTAAAIRRTLMSLVQAGLVESSERPPFGPSPTRGRGRPGQIFSLTNSGRAALGQSYDGLAIQALRFLQRTAGDEAIASFARDWAAGHLARGEGTAADPPMPGAYSVETVAARLNDAGFAVTVHPVGSHSVQLCQHACPVSEAAAAFPVLCEAETAVLSDVLGRHVTRLATIAHGDGVCTTLIPTDETARVPVAAEHAPRIAPEREVTA
jgi:predicted ArsR family transcriptional regulator